MSECVSCALWEYFRRNDDGEKHIQKKIIINENDVESVKFNFTELYDLGQLQQPKKPKKTRKKMRRDKISVFVIFLLVDENKIVATHVVPALFFIHFMFSVFISNGEKNKSRISSSDAVIFFFLPAATTSFTVDPNHPIHHISIHFQVHVSSFIGSFSSWIWRTNYIIGVGIKCTNMPLAPDLRRSSAKGNRSKSNE